MPTTNLTLAFVLGTAGAILILVAGIGGGFTISALSVPRVGVAGRVLSSVMGGLLVVFALVTYDMDNAVSTSTSADSSTESANPSGSATPINNPAEPQQAPVTVPIISPDGYSVNLFSDVTTSSTVLGSLADGQSVTVICTMQGDSVTSEINGHASSLWNGVSVGGGNTIGYVPDVYVGTDTYQPTMPSCEDMANTSRA